MKYLNTFFNLFLGKPPNLTKTLYIPPDDRTSAIDQEEGQYLFRFIKRNRITKTLEIGLGYGISASYIISVTGNIHFAMDP